MKIKQKEKESMTTWYTQQAIPTVPAPPTTIVTHAPLQKKTEESESSVFPIVILAIVSGFAILALIFFLARKNNTSEVAGQAYPYYSEPVEQEIPSVQPYPVFYPYAYPSYPYENYPYRRPWPGPRPPRPPGPRPLPTPEPRPTPGPGPGPRPTPLPMPRGR